MTNANEAIEPVHNRMPVLLHKDEYEQWLHGSFDDARAFEERTFPPELLAMDRTTELWSKKKTVAEKPLLL
ncbi:SOS response-associated peptidase family protein [Rhizobium populisoli]|uniref:SOS response-associated peptidase family protein n=1 Tax=Rhizobium populisoli TaxID=2859785 RepID=UPI001FE75896|nr:SOS response-associated peptidase family protein [Rhizobium populisoli]